MTKYGRLQILKHALEYYIQRPEATPSEIKVETSILKQITHEVNQFKEQHHIEFKKYQVIHSIGDTWEFECSSEKSARRRAFRYYKKERPFTIYEEFMNNVKVKEIK